MAAIATADPRVFVTLTQRGVERVKVTVRLVPEQDTPAGEEGTSDEREAT